ncbi:Phosphoinositide phospholipase C 2 [Acorus gramineus]|uniref:Phosphoinositide phospholipase C n=1 Tax=Acorus gramineus TaxID=55184 RepID=A0AAV9B7E9_ACOGR|nr:Phosphoinositide phospholipase C 2 [Acorus gramineus]
MSTYRVCFFYKRRFRQATAEAPMELRELFERYSENGAMGVEQLQRFLVEVQGEEGVTREEAQAIIDSVLRDSKYLIWFPKKGEGSLGLDSFFRYLFGESNPPLSPSVHHDMTAPLSHYFIYTGHNSYLTGNQLSSDCSVVPITNALKRGVRGIELDMWPNARKNNVDILHGRTLTTPVELIKCLKSIKEHAFSASLYPVIITLEDHLTPDLQANVAEMVTQTFGDMLFYPKSDGREEFPSPEELKTRITLSTKPPKEYLESKSFKDKDSGSISVKEDVEDAWGKELLGLKSFLDDEDKESFKIIVLSDRNGSEHNHDEEDLDDGDHTINQSIAPEYKRLITIYATKPKLGLREALKVDPNRVKRLSLSEQELAKASHSYSTQLVRFTQKNMLRVYPKGTRFNSSNYNPLIGWMYGAQMVAFNMQGYGRSLWLMHGKFRANGGCGYVKKPDILLKADENGHIFDPKAKLPVKKTLKVVKVYMGDGWNLDFHKTHFDMYSPPDFYTRIGIAGVPADTIMKKTQIMEDDWTPVWNEEFTFPLTVPELALLRIEVHEHNQSEKDNFGGQTCLPVSELKTGVRAVPLCNRKGEKYKSVKLLMRFKFV